MSEIVLPFIGLAIALAVVYGLATLAAHLSDKIGGLLTGLLFMGIVWAAIISYLG